MRRMQDGEHKLARGPGRALEGQGQIRDVRLKLGWFCGKSVHNLDPILLVLLPEVERECGVQHGAGGACHAAP